MKNLFYIRNTQTDQNFDVMENKFYDSSWEPNYEYDKEWLQGMIDEDPKKFENCVVETVGILEVMNRRKLFSELENDLTVSNHWS